MVNTYTVNERGIYTYFIVSEDGFVKIGVAKNPWDRLKGLQTANPHNLSLELLILGDIEIERLMHKLLKKHHHRGEWFKFEGILKQLITYAPNIYLAIDELYFINVKQWVF